jgi:hypothetical protein
MALRSWNPNTLRAVPMLAHQEQVRGAGTVCALKTRGRGARQLYELMFGKRILLAKPN